MDNMIHFYLRTQMNHHLNENINSSQNPITISHAPFQPFPLASPKDNLYPGFSILDWLCFL